MSRGESTQAIPPRPIGVRRKAAFIAIILTIVAVGAGGAVRFALYLYYGGINPESDRLYEYDQMLGWKNLKSRHFPNRYGPGMHVTHNADGLRGRTEYSVRVPRGRVRVVALGDSFTYGVVGDEETFPAQIEARCPAIEAINMGTPAYGIDQAYLAYMRDGRRWLTDVLLFSVIADDFLRMGMEVFLSRYPKPRLALDGASLAVRNVPVPTWGDGAPHGWADTLLQRPAWLRLVANVKQTVFKPEPLQNIFPVAARIFDHLDPLSRARGQAFVVVYLPSHNEIINRAPAEASRMLEAFAQQRTFQLWNLTSAFAKLPRAELSGYFIADGHLSARGNALVAAELLARLRASFGGPASPLERCAAR